MQRATKLLEAISKALSAVALAVWVVALVGLPLAASLDRSVMVDVPFGFEPQKASLSLPGQADPVSVTSASGDLPLDVAASVPTALLALLGLTIVLLPAAYGFRLAGRLFSDVAAGTPLTPDNAARLRAVGIVVIVADLAWAAYDWAIQEAVARQATQEVGLRAAPQVHLGVLALFAGAALIVFATVWRRAAALQSDADLTI